VIEDRLPVQRDVSTEPIEIGGARRQSMTSGGGSSSMLTTARLAIEIERRRRHSARREHHRPWQCCRAGRTSLDPLFRLAGMSLDVA
jgi:hypothetical protein